MKTCASIFVTILVLTSAVFGQGTILWDESVNGPLSPMNSSPTPLGSLTTGTNRIIGAVEAQPTQLGWTGTEDYFTFSVPAGSSLTGIFLHVDNRVISWIGNETFSNELGSKINPAIGELLIQMNLSSLPTGPYGMYMSPNELQPFATVSSYTLGLFVQSIPEPGTLALLLVGLGLVGFRSWKKFH